MQILKIHVPNFRNLKNVTLTFEPELTPQVFPISSENGGGKSTLLQLIFVLLSCFCDEKKRTFLENITEYFDFRKMSTEEEIHPETILSIDILYKKQIIDLQFFYIISEFEEFSGHSWTASTRPKTEQKTLPLIIKREDSMKEFYLGIDDIKLDIIPSLFAIHKIEKGRELEYQNRISRIEELKKELEDLITKYPNSFEGREFAESQLKDEIYLLENSSPSNDNAFSFSKIEFMQMQGEKNTILYPKFFTKNNVDIMLFCQTTVNKYDLALEVLEKCREKVFLAAPPTQSFIFINRETKKTLFSISKNYEKSLLDLDQSLPNFYLYNKLALKGILNVFKESKEKDWKTAIKTLKYSNSFQETVQEFHHFLGDNKYIFPNKVLDSIIVRRMNSERDYLEIDPEDLSHGELKRLGLYAWIKYTVGDDAIVLIDEIENGLHPDWQYSIVQELASWGNNQYLLATHSFHLCEALTPRHVKEIEPKMVNPADKNNDN
ncbi:MULTISPECIES: AAA family ATPase [Spirulina sp. CCY15215]|uniref:AAA family ATPase n=1 Tax=Spirulina sp. CCY15215 TaxID=2767591 RepID=UPI0019515F25|nr:AAA family ATPase [Spirulina major]